MAGTLEAGEAYTIEAVVMTANKEMTQGRAALMVHVKSGPTGCNLVAPNQYTPGLKPAVIVNSFILVSVEICIINFIWCFF